MDNDGSSNPNGPWARSITTDSWVQRQILAHAHSLNEAINGIIPHYASSTGGTCGSGCVFVMAHNALPEASCAIYEGDRLGGDTRWAGEKYDPAPLPSVEQTLMATNHFYKYGWTAATPQRNFGVPIDYDSQWRYTAGSNVIAAYHQHPTPIGTMHVRRLLQTMAEQYTEHSVIMRHKVSASGVTFTFDVAVADDGLSGWNAPYLEWQTFDFASLFALF